MFEKVQGYRASLSLRADGKNSDELVISSNFPNSSLRRTRKSFGKNDLNEKFRF